MWMAAGFTMLESGSVRTKNASVICLKNLGLYAIAGLAFYVVGYNIMYVDVTGWVGSFSHFYTASDAENLPTIGNQVGTNGIKSILNTLEKIRIRIRIVR